MCNVSDFSRSLYACQTATTFLLLVSTVSVSLFAQAITAKAMGTVTDPTGAVVPNAKVTIRNQHEPGSNQSTDSAGNYEFSFVPVGAYAWR